jgi:CubicO group peptidase (beta-lactamase class C family)
VTVTDCNGKRWFSYIAKFKVILLLRVLIVAGSLSAAPPVWRETGREVSELSVLDETMRDFMLSREVSAGALAMTYEGRLVFARGYGWTGPDLQATEPQSLFRIASLSKPVTSAAVLKLVESGKLRLDEKVAQTLSLECPEGQDFDPNLQDVTILHLLQHLGGWDRDKAFDPMFADERISKALGLPMPISQSDIIDYMNGLEKNVLAPLGITRMRLGRSRFTERAATEVKYDPNDPLAYGGFNIENMDSHGGWLASAPELVRFAAAFDKPGDCPILSAESIETMFALPETISSDSYERGAVYYGCGWNIRDYGNDSRNTWHNGSLPGCYTFMVRWRNGVDCVVLFNKRGDGFGEIDPLLRKAVNSVTTWPEHDLFDDTLESL